MTKRPSFQFYPADWLNDIKLQSCSLAAHGLLIDLMCLMHQSERYGHLLINGSVPANKDVARLLRLHHKTYDKALIELILKGVLSQDETGCILCKRMVKDEHIRQVRAASGKLGGNPLLKQMVNQDDKQKSTPSSSPSSSSSSSSSKKETYTYPDWLDANLWKQYKTMRQRIKSPMTPFAEQLAIGKLKKVMAEEDCSQQEVIEAAIMNGWKTFWPPRGNNGDQKRLKEIAKQILDNDGYDSYAAYCEKNNLPYQKMEITYEK